MKLVVGLGNPGRKYEGTRHNVGFEVLAELARRHGGDRVRTAFQAEVIEVRVGNEPLLLLAPQTFMNLSGRSVVLARDFYKLKNEEVLVVCDDLHLDVGKLRLRMKGSSGGQKGLQDIIRALGGEEVPRLRIGVGEPPASRDPAEWVLSRFGSKDRQEIDLAVQRAADAVALWAREGIMVCMNQFNC